MKPAPMVPNPGSGHSLMTLWVERFVWAVAG